MERRDSSVSIGWLLVLLGMVILLQNMGLFGPIGAFVWIILFALGGAAFLSAAVQNRKRWWASIPGMLFLSIAGLIALHEMAPQLGERWGGSLFLGGFSLGFWAITLFKRDAWWAVIPAGIISTLAVVAGLAQIVTESFAGAALFAGLSLTFVLVYVLRSSAGWPAVWALIVAGGAMLLAFTTLSDSALFLGLLWPLVIIAGGVALLVRALRHSEQQKEGEHYEQPTFPQSHG
jgi:hypothetical protein